MKRNKRITVDEIKPGFECKFHKKLVTVTHVNRFWNSDGKLLCGAVHIDVRILEQWIDLHKFVGRAIRTKPLKIKPPRKTAIERWREKRA